MPDIPRVRRRVHIAGSVREDARSEHECHAARAHGKVQQSLPCLVLEVILNDLVACTRHTTHIHMSRVTTQDHILGDQRSRVFGSGGLYVFLKKAHFPLACPSQAHVQARRCPIIVQSFFNLQIRGRTLALAPFCRTVLCKMAMCDVCFSNGPQPSVWMVA